MSIESVRSVLESSKAKGSERLLLLVIAEHADKDGIAWPGNELLARESAMSKRQVQRLIQSLVDKNELDIVQEGDGRGNKRIMRVSIKGDKSATKGDKSVTLLEKKRVTNPTIKGDIFDTKGDKSVIKGDIAMSPEPLNHKNQIEPSSVPTPKPIPSDRDGRWTIAKIEAKGFMYMENNAKALAMKLESEYTDTQLLQAIETTHQAHMKKIATGNRGITAPLAYIASVLAGNQPVTVNGNGNAAPVRKTQSARSKMQVLS